MTEQYRADGAWVARMQNPAFVRAYDIWLLVLTQQAAEVELARRGLRHQQPRRSPARPKTRPRPTVPRTA